MQLLVKRSAARHDAGFLYIAQNPPLYKIGVTYFPAKRMRQLRCWCCGPSPKDWAAISNWSIKNTRPLHVVTTNNMARAEMQVWSQIQGKRCTFSEWFWLTPEDIAWLCSLTHIET